MLMNFCLLLFAGLLVFSGEVTVAAPVSAVFRNAELTEQIKFGADKLVQNIYYSSDLSKVLMLGRKSALKDRELAGKLNVPNWRLTVSSTKDLLLLSRGLSENEITVLLSSLQQTWTASLLKETFIPKAEAAEVCEPKLTASGLLNKTTSEIFSKVSVTNAVKNCDFDLVEMIHKAFDSVIDTYTNFDLASFTKLTEVWDALKYAVTQLATDLVQTLAPLAEKAPKIVEGMICEMMKSHTPGLVMAAVLPGGVKRLPFELARIVDDVRKIVRSPTILKLIESSRFDSDLRLLPGIFKRITHVVPELFKSLKFRDANLVKHFEAHGKEFPNLKSAEAYRKRIEEFATESNSKIIHQCVPGGRCSKLNLETGEYLIVADDGYFVSFYKLRGDTPQERFNFFMDKTTNYNGIVKEH